jgi:competence protein ComEC
MDPHSRVQWTAYPALLAAGALAVGILLEAYGSFGVAGWLVAGAGTGSMAALATAWRPPRVVHLAPLARTLLLGGLVVCVGGAAHAAYLMPAPKDVRWAARSSFATAGDLTLIGTVRDAPTQDASSTRFGLDAARLHAAGDTVSTTGAVQVTLRASPWDSTAAPFPVVTKGTIVQITGRLRPLPVPRNPGAFDYGDYLARRGIGALLYAREASAVQVRRPARGLDALLADARRAIRDRLHRFCADSNTRALLQALLLGDRSDVSDRVTDAFARTGLMHLLAVSGLHVLLVGMVLHTLLRPVLLRLRLRRSVVDYLRAGCTVAILCGYALLAGGRPSIVRAVVMTTLLIGGLLMQRRAHPLNTLGVAGLVLLVARPPALFDAGFQLSFAAVGGLLTLTPRFRPLVPSAWRARRGLDYLWTSGIASTAATLSTAPVLVAHFGQVSFAGLVLNVTAIPCTALLLIAGGVVAGAGGVVPGLGVTFGAAADVLGATLTATATWGEAAMEWTLFGGANLGGWQLAAAVAVLLAVVQWPRPRHRWRFLLLGVLLFAAGGWKAATQTGAAHLDIIFFDVGHGDAALLSTPEGRHVLIDTGSRSRQSSAAAYAILPFLAEQGIDHLDAVLVTHPDRDHLGGLPDLLSAVSVGRILHSGAPIQTALQREVVATSQAHGVDRQLVTAGDTLRIAPSVQARVLGPPPGRERVREENDRSVVLQLLHGRNRLLFTGDIEEAAEAWLVQSAGTLLRSDMVKVPHHGSRTSSTDAFVEAASDSSTMAVVSVDADGRYGLPAEEVINRWEKAASAVYSTADHGAVWLRSDGERLWRAPW